MRKIWSIVKNTFVGLVLLLAVCMMIFTLVSVATFDRGDRRILGYQALVVLSDSMSKTDFQAGDLILVKETDPAILKEGDIIAYVSRDSANFGEIVTHKIRTATTTADGERGFITYGTTTGIDDKHVVFYSDIRGQYAARLPKVGTFFTFLKTVPGYIAFILIPFLVLLLYQGIGCVRLFRDYRKEQMQEMRAERELLESERAMSRKMIEELKALKEELGIDQSGECEEMQ